MNVGGWLTRKRCLKAVLSIFVVYHLAAVIVLPMGSGLVIRELGRYFVSYANLFDLNTSWVFFSPGPSPIFYLEYTYTYPAKNDDDDSLNESEPQLLPEKRVGFSVSDFYNRRLYSMRFLSLDPEKMERYLVPWLCKQDAKAESVSVRELFGEIESVEKHRGKFGADSFSDMTEPKTMPRQTFHCPGPA
ncbi:hypothetical protein BH10BDE1_BH10BDE1_12530 [soil metagenome]